MTISTVPKTNANASTEELLAVDVSDIIWHVGEPTEAPLITLTGGKLYKEGKNDPEEVAAKIKRELATQVEYKVIEKNPLTRTVTVNGAIASTSTATVVLVSNAALRVKDTIKNTKQVNGEVMYVIAVDSGGTDITVRRNLGTTLFQIADGDTLEIIGFAGRDGGTKAPIRAQLATPRTRRCQIYKRSFGVTDTLKNVNLETKYVDAWGEEQTQGLVEHKKDIEFSFWMNPNADTTTDANSFPVNLSRGILAELRNSSNFIHGGGGVSEDYFFSTIAERIFKYGPTRKAFLVDSRLKSIMSGWSRVKQQTKPKETAYGINLQEIETSHGILEIMTNGVFNRFLPESQMGFGVAMDFDRVVYKFIKNRDSKFADNIETPGTDAREAQYITECGLSLRSLKHHIIVEGIA